MKSKDIECPDQADSQPRSDGKKDGETAPPYKSHAVIWFNNPDWERGGGRERKKEGERGRERGDVEQVVCH